MKRFLSILALTAFVAVGIAVGQLQIMQSMPTQTYVVPGSSTVILPAVDSRICSPNCNQHYIAIDNQGPGTIAFAYSATITQVTITVNGASTNVWNGMLISSNVFWEIPASKQYNGPIAAVCVNGTSIVAVTDGFLPNN